MAAVAVDAGVEAPPLEERDVGVEAELPARLRVAPVDALRVGRERTVPDAHDVRTALLEPRLPRPAVAGRGDHGAGRVELRRADLVHEEVGDAEPDAVLRLAAAAHREELRPAHVLDAVAVRGVLRPDFPGDPAAAQELQARRQLVAPRL